MDGDPLKTRDQASAGASGESGGVEESDARVQDQHNFPAESRRTVFLVRAVAAAAALTLHLALRPMASSYGATAAAYVGVAVSATLLAVEWYSNRRREGARLSWAHILGPGLCSALFIFNPLNWAALAALLLSAYSSSWKSGRLAAGLVVAAVSSGGTLFGAWLVAGRADAWNLRQFLLAAPCVFAIGAALAWLGAERAAGERRSELLNSIARISNPRFGVERTLGIILEKLRGHFTADCCLLAFRGEDGAQTTVQRADVRRAGAFVERLPASAAKPLFALPCGVAAIYRGGGGALVWTRNSVAKLFPRAGRAAKLGLASEDSATVEIAEELEASSFISVPIPNAVGGEGRIYLISRGAHEFTEGDLRFLTRLVASFMPAVENMRLLDGLVSESAGRERKRIARDLHDTTVQPFIGMKMGLMALREKLTPEQSAAAAADIVKLIRLTEAEIGSLRGYVSELKTGEAPKTTFLTAVRHFVEKYEESSGIKVDVVVGDKLDLNDRLAAEAFQMIAEGLSNVRRHTAAASVVVSIGCCDRFFKLRIENDGGPSGSFFPKSITERAAALGGSARVENAGHGVTSMTVSIPL